VATSIPESPRNISQARFLTRGLTLRSCPHPGQLFNSPLLHPPQTSLSQPSQLKMRSMTTKHTWQHLLSMVVVIKLKNKSIQQIVATATQWCSCRSEFGFLRPSCCLLLKPSILRYTVKLQSYFGMATQVSMVY
jgi:hypothetical protein